MNEKIAEVIREYLGDDELEITSETNLMTDLGIASIDVLNLANEFEEAFNIKIKDTDIPSLKTVGDIEKFISAKK